MGARSAARNGSMSAAKVNAGVVAAMKGFKTNDGKELGDLIIAKIKEAVRKVEF